MIVGVTPEELALARVQTESREDRKLKKQDFWNYSKIREHLFKGASGVLLAEQAVETVKGILKYKEEKGIRPNTALQANKLRAAELVLAYVAGKPTQIIEQSGPDGESIAITFGQAKD